MRLYSEDGRDVLKYIKSDEKLAMELEQLKIRVEKYTASIARKEAEIAAVGLQRAGAVLVPPVPM